MGFKLGTNIGNYATGGEIKTKLSFGRKPSGEESNSPMAKKDFDFKKTMDLNVDRYGPSATQTNIDFTKKSIVMNQALK